MNDFADLNDWFKYVDEAWVEVDYCAHPIRPWAVEERCWYCQDLATHKAEESDVYNTHPLTTYLCCVHFWGHCADAPKCARCGHRWPQHEQEIKWRDGEVLIECTAAMGMGDWCGCKEKRP